MDWQDWYISFYVHVYVNHWPLQVRRVLKLMVAAGFPMPDKLKLEAMLKIIEELEVQVWYLFSNVTVSLFHPVVIFKRLCASYAAKLIPPCIFDGISLLLDLLLKKSEGAYFWQRWQKCVYIHVRNHVRNTVFSLSRVAIQALSSVIFHSRKTMECGTL